MNRRFALAERLKKLPPYLFAELDRMKKEACQKGLDVIDLGVGDPDLPTPDFVIRKLQEAAVDPSNHRYPGYGGMIEFRRAAAVWMKKSFNVDLDPETEIISLIGSKEGIAHLPLAYINPGDGVLVPDPGYPVYQASAHLAGGEVIVMPLLEKNGFLPDFTAFTDEQLKKAKIVFLNYPNNPTSAVAGKDFFGEAVRMAEKNGLIVCHDAAYSEIAYDDLRIPSFLEVDGAKEVGVEFHSLSKTFNMTGWRVGFAAGNSEVIGALGRVKTNIDSGVFQAIQRAAVEALEGFAEVKKKIVRIYQERRDIFVSGLREAGWEVQPPGATFYLWAGIPREEKSSMELAKKLISEKGIVATPGVGFGLYGEGYIRFSLTVSKERLREAASRLKE